MNDPRWFDMRTDEELLELNTKIGKEGQSQFLLAAEEAQKSAKFDEDGNYIPGSRKLKHRE